MPAIPYLKLKRKNWQQAEPLKSNLHNRNNNAHEDTIQNHSAPNNKIHDSDTQVTSKQSDSEQAILRGYESEPLKTFQSTEAIPPTPCHDIQQDDTQDTSEIHSYNWCRIY